MWPGAALRRPKRLKALPVKRSLEVKKAYRLVYSFDANKIYLLRFAHRKEIYRLKIGWN